MQRDSTRQAPSREFAKWVKTARAEKAFTHSVDSGSFERFMRQHNAEVQR